MTALTYKQKIILVALFVTLFLVSSIYWYQSSLLNQPLIEQPTTLDNSVEQLEHQSNDNVQLDIEEQTLIYVHVKGAVNSPGVYQLTSKSRVLHAVEAAGGVNLFADLNLINLAAELSDGQEVIVFTSEEDKEKWKQISANTFVGAGLIAQPSNGLININLADSQTLQKLPGIGPAKSQAIISYREQNGTFNNIQDLLKVSGIGDATFTNLEALVTVK